MALEGARLCGANLFGARAAASKNLAAHTRFKHSNVCSLASGDSSDGNGSAHSLVIGEIALTVAMQESNFAPPPLCLHQGDQRGESNCDLQCLRGQQDENARVQ